jgi:hypothetical protein
VKAIIRAEKPERSAFREEFRRRTGCEELLAVKRVDNFVVVQGIDFDAESGMFVFRSTGDFADLRIERAIFLRRCCVRPTEQSDGTRSCEHAKQKFFFMVHCRWLELFLLKLIFLAFTFAGGNGKHIGNHRRQAYIMRDLNHALNNHK